jgi:hypothetical protein
VALAIQQSNIVENSIAERKLKLLFGKRYKGVGYETRDPHIDNSFLFPLELPFIQRNSLPIKIMALSTDLCIFQ